ncbi:glycosyltransferase family 4 protein [bacterium]|nr:glycosyltransferase family 4 protein [bacterium]
MKRILVLTCDLIGHKMAGPAIRALEMARVLASDNDVEISCPEINGVLPDSSDFPDNLSVSEYGTSPRWNDMDKYQVVIIPASMNVDAHIRPPLVVDLYDPYILSNLPRTDKSELVQLQELQALKRNLQQGDFFVCASQRQRDFWIGMLAAEGRINVQQFKADSNLDRLIQLAPFGISETRPVRGARRFPGDTDAFRLVWAGGIWDWFDPLTLIQAVHNLCSSGVNVTLYFMGTQHPNPNMTDMSMAQKAENLALELNELNESVFFGDWIPYHERGEILCEAHAGVSTHYPHLETRFSFRTRILYYVWARLPFICTEGDAFGDIAGSRKTGIAVMPEDVDALTDAIKKMIIDREIYGKCQQNIDDLASEMIWPNVLKPLRSFCSDPYFAVDRNIAPLRVDDESEYIDGSENSISPAGEILGDGIEQIVSVPGGGLCRLDLKLASFDRLNTGMGVLELIDSTGLKLVTIPFDLETVEDNQWRKFYFGPLPRFPDEKILIRLKMHGVSTGNTITIWTDPSRSNSIYKQNGQDHVGSINYRVYSLNYPGADQVMKSYSDGFYRRARRWLKR